MPYDSNKTVLDNGIRIVTKEIHQARSVAMGVWVNVGARDEQPEEGGLRCGGSRRWKYSA